MKGLKDIFNKTNKRFHYNDIFGIKESICFRDLTATEQVWAMRRLWATISLTLSQSIVRVLKDDTKTPIGVKLSASKLAFHVKRSGRSIDATDFYRLLRASIVRIGLELLVKYKLVIVTETVRGKPTKHMPKLVSYITVWRVKDIWFA